MKFMSSFNTYINELSKSPLIFKSILSNQKLDTSVMFIGYRHGTIYYLDYTDNTETKKTYYLENVDSKNKRINPNYILLKLFTIEYILSFSFS